MDYSNVLGCSVRYTASGICRKPAIHDKSTFRLYGPYAAADLFTSGPGGSSLFSIASQFAAPFLSQPAEAGALPILFAATDPKARGGGYYGPGGFSELTGPPSKASIMIQARDSATAKRLWDISETLTGVSFEGAQ